MLKLNDRQKDWICRWLDWADEADETLDDPDYDLIHVNTSFDWYILTDESELPENGGYITTDEYYPYSIGCIKDGYYKEYDVITPHLYQDIIQHA